MPADAVSVAVTTNVSNPTNHTVTLPNTLDSIWTVTAASAGGTKRVCGNTRTAQENQTVTVTVTRSDAALTSSIGGITVKDGGNQTVGHPGVFNCGRL
jgi:hypothetical protein